MGYEDDGESWYEMTLTAANDVYIIIKGRAKKLFDDQHTIDQFYEDVIEHLLKGDSIKEQMKELQAENEELERGRAKNRKNLIGWIR